jgi:hypothetical protein
MIDIAGGIGMRLLTLALFVMSAACTTEAPAPAGAPADDPAPSQSTIKPHDTDGPVPGAVYCGAPGNCTVGGADSTTVCRAICGDPGIPWFTSGCWDTGGPPTAEIGECFYCPGADCD